jgi:hypothetical protein
MASVDPAVQRVVVAALVVRLGRLANGTRRADREHRVAALPVSAAVRHVGVRPEVVPTSRERRPIGQSAGLLQQRAHVRRVHEGVAVGPDEVS